MHANKHQFGGAITSVSATNGAQRTARPTMYGNFGCRLLHRSVTPLAAAKFFDCGE